ncbi:MAG: hypothetical protein HYY59_04895 [Candidatus Omnitrophica bacterium]|nr:hypothetical protein [Candidatus Omnitrophota bacterium]
MDKSIPVLSLVVAALAVFVGPLISWLIARRQLASSLEVSNKQIIAPMRQAWINNLRDLLAELTSSALHYHVAGYEDRTDKEYQRLTLLEHKVALILNPLEEDHSRLEQLIRKMVSAIARGREGDEEFVQVHPAVVDLSRQVLKREWNRIRDRIQSA